MNEGQRFGGQFGQAVQSALKRAGGGFGGVSLAGIGAGLGVALGNPEQLHALVQMMEPFAREFAITGGAGLGAAAFALVQNASGWESRLKKQETEIGTLKTEVSQTRDLVAQAVRMLENMKRDRAPSTMRAVR